jgi:hypothetical protein
MLASAHICHVGSGALRRRGDWSGGTGPLAVLMRGGMRGAGINLPANPDSVGMPARVFLFTLDQISVMLDISERQIKEKYLYFEGRSIGTKRRDLMIARNIAGQNDTPDWRVTEREFIRWMKVKGFKYYERGAFQ